MIVKQMKEETNKCDKYFCHNILKQRLSSCNKYKIVMQD